MSFRGLADFLRASRPLVAPTRAPYFSLLVQRKVSKRKHAPTSGSGLRPDFPPSGAASGAVTKGRPCPFVPRSASCLASPCATPPLGLLTGISARLMQGCENASQYASVRSPREMGPGLVPSEGRMESLCKGLSGMDAARAPMGQGRPFGACPWNNGGVRGVERSETRMSGASVFGYFFRDWKK